MTRARSVLLFSGGIDSTLALQWALDEGREVHVLQIDFPSRPEGERRAATKILHKLRPHAGHRVEIGFLAPTGKPPGYLPTRNLLFHVVAQSLAETIGARSVIAGHLREDAEGFPDAEPGFFTEIQRLAARGRPTNRAIPIENPLHPAIAQQLAHRVQVPLTWTWSCWRAGTRPCGRCEKCVRRAEVLRRFNRPTRKVSASRTPKASRARSNSRSSPR